MSKQNSHGAKRHLDVVSEGTEEVLAEKTRNYDLVVEGHRQTQDRDSKPGALGETTRRLE